MEDIRELSCRMVTPDDGVSHGRATCTNTGCNLQVVYNNTNKKIGQNVLQDYNEMRAARLALICRVTGSKNLNADLYI